MGGTVIRAGVVGMAAAFPMLAQASGQLPIMPSREPFPSHAACVAVLTRFEAEDQREVAPKTQTADGGTTEVSLDTTGVERTRAASARYDATLWWHNGIPRTDLPQIEISHSYRHRIRACDGRVLRTTGEDGYTMSTFAPREPPAAPR